MIETTDVHTLVTLYLTEIVKLLDLLSDLDMPFEHFNLGDPFANVVKLEWEDF